MTEQHTQSPPTKEGKLNPSHLPFFKWLGDLNIRLKIISPFLVLTLLVAMIGIYMITRLVFTSLDERLDNHALEAGRVVSNILVRQDVNNQSTIRDIAYTKGFATALNNGDWETATDLALPVAQSKNVELLLAIDTDAQIMTHLRQVDGQVVAVDDPLNMDFAGNVLALLQSKPSASVERRAIARYPLTQQYYYITAVSIHSRTEGFVGVIVLGTSLDTLLPQFKLNSLADVVLYLNDGEVAATTLTEPISEEDIKEFEDALRISPEDFAERQKDYRESFLSTVTIKEREYRLATGALYVGTDVLGVFSVAFPTDFVFTAGEASRNTYFFVFVAVTAGIIGVGYWIAQSIVLPVRQLTDTSQAVTHGDLQRRAELTGKDEIGQLGRDFDKMTETLSERNFELQKALSENYAILHSIGDGVLLEDLKGNIVPSNPAANMMLAEMSKQFGQDLAPLRILPVTQARFADGEDNPWQMERQRIQVGEKFVTAHSAPVRMNEGELLGTVIVLRDVTAEVEAEQIKDAFVEHVSHELRTPLTSIKGYSDLLLATTRDLINVQQQQFLKTIIHQTDNLTTMVNALLDFSEMQASGRLGLRTQPTDIVDMLKELEQDWQPEIEDKGLEFYLSVADDIPPVIEADSKRLRWAVMNLIRNANQYTDEGSVTIDVKMDSPRRLSIVVSDTGIGISPENQSRIFTRFYRVMNVDDDRVRGLGLGLYVSKAIVEAHKGTLNVQSTLNVGSTFTITLPVV